MEMALIKLHFDRHLPDDADPFSGSLLKGGSNKMTELTLISGDEARELNAEDLFSRLGSTPKGLSNAEAGQRLEVYGPNSLQEKKGKPLLKFLS